MAWNRYITPFSYRLWLAVAIAAFVLCVCLALTNFSNNSKQRLSLIDTLFYIPTCFCQQGQKVNLIYEVFILLFMLLLLVPFFHICCLFVGFLLNNFYHSFSNSYSIQNIPLIN